METYLSASQIITNVLVAAFFGLMGILIAGAKGRNKWLGFFVGLVGLPGWIVLALIPSRRDQADVPGHQGGMSPRA